MKDEASREENDIESEITESSVYVEKLKFIGQLSGTDRLWIYAHGNCKQRVQQSIKLALAK